MIFAIKPFEIHDGDGIRTTVFLKGCPLRCQWCHNPESLCSQPQLSYDNKKCVACGSCAEVCECHIIKNGIHSFDRENCIGCGKCTKVCPASALKIYGEEYSIDELLKILLEDRGLFEASGGGVTLSGGEPLMQADYCAELLKRLKAEGVNTALDTSLFASKESIDKVIDYIDTFLCDIKTFDEDLHIKCTGQSNKNILENIKYVDSKNKRIEIRIPYVPGFNDSQIEKIGRFIKELRNVSRVVVLPYHGMSKRKYECLGNEFLCESVTAPSKKMIDDAIELLKNMGINAMRNED